MATALTFSNRSNAIRGFRENLGELAANLDNDAIRMDFLNSNVDGTYSISIEAVADYQADRKGVVSGSTLQGVPALRTSVGKRPVASSHKLFDALPLGTARKDAIAAAVDAGIAYFTARTQYQAWSKARAC